MKLFLSILTGISIAAQALAAEVDITFTSGDDTKKILFIAGRPSHAHGQHEHRAGCMLLADALNKSDLKVEAKVQWYGWPKQAEAFKDVDMAVIYADAGGRMDEGIQKLMNTKVKKGMGIMFIHYGVHPKPTVGEQYFLDWTGAYFKNGTSVNPHWIADIIPLEGHAVANGIPDPIKAFDEFYFNMKKKDGCPHCLALASATPTPERILRYNNLWHNLGDDCFGTPQALMWARDPKDGAGRGIGWVGGHFHANWAIENFRKLTLNAIVWGCRLEVPKQGVQSAKITKEMLNQNLDRGKGPYEIELPGKDIFERKAQERPDRRSKYKNMRRNTLLTPSWKKGDPADSDKAIK